MIETSNMGLVIWDLESDDFDHSKLANNFNLIDQHNHAGIIENGIFEDGDLLSEKEYEEAKHLHEVTVPTPKTEILNYAEGNTAVGRWFAVNSGEAIRTPETTGRVNTAIKPETIWRYLIARRAVGHNQIDVEGVWKENLKDGSVSETKIKDEAVSSKKLKKGVIPLGAVMAWYKSAAEETPGGPWEICNGREWTTVTNNLGAGGAELKTGKMPDLREKFIRGNNTGTESSGGARNYNFAHTHGVASHTHTINAHTHGVEDHIHTPGTLELHIGLDGVHKHDFGFGHGIFSRQNVPDIMGAASFNTTAGNKAGNKQSLFIATENEGNVEANEIPMKNGVYESTGTVTHQHGGWAGLSGERRGNTGGATGAINTTAVGLTTNSTALTTESSLGNYEIEPPWIGLAYIMRVRN